jgi:unsaturated chondroitin disaccharide hydrolase
VQVIPAVSLNGAHPVATEGLPRAPWEVSFDVRVAGGARMTLAEGRAVVARFTRRSYRRRGWLGVHVELTGSRLDVNGRSLRRVGGAAGPLRFSVSGGRALVAALIISSGADRGALLLHRLAELHARVPRGRFPLGATMRDRVQYADRYWTNGFWAGALWQAAALAPAGRRGLFARWALAGTTDHFGFERSDTHDVGFMYGQSSLAAWRALCRGRSSVLCARLKRSVLSAAGELLALEATNDRAGTIPTNATSGDTIIDSMMNIGILPWASRVTGDPRYSRVALRHALVVASLLVRPDGSTAQSVNFDRVSGRVLFVSTHQGLSNNSTWSRGQGWAVYGFAQAAADLHDVALLRVALRTAAYVARHLPAGGVPLWDYDASAGAPVDVSAGVITATGLLQLARACRVVPGVCTRPARWVALARRMLSASLARASVQPPLGLLRDQVLNERGPGCWCDGGELIFGLTYALEAERLLRGRV